MKRHKTEAQIQAAKERRAKFTRLVQAVAKMTDEERQSIFEQLGTVPTCEGHALSIFNTCLLFSQAGPTISMVGGFQQWRRAGRQVRKGEHGYAIWVPIATGKQEPSDADDSDDKLHFILGTVFDISQTDPISQLSEESQVA